jgi:hypothetical protein
MYRDPFWTPDPWKMPDPWKIKDPWKVKDPFGVDLDAERRRARQAREDRRARLADETRQTRLIELAPRPATARDEARAQPAKDSLAAQAAAVEAERQAEAKRRHLAGPARDGRHEREQIEDRAERAAKAAEAPPAMGARARAEPRERPDQQMIHKDIAETAAAEAQAAGRALIDDVCTAVCQDLERIGSTVQGGLLEGLADVIESIRSEQESGAPEREAFDAMALSVRHLAHQVAALFEAQSHALRRLSGAQT